MRHLNKEATAIFTEIIRLVGKRAYLKLDNAPGVFMPLSIDRTGKHTFAFAHNSEQNGDLMADPDMTFFIDNDGAVYPLTYQNDYVGAFTDTVHDWQDDRPVKVDAKEQASLVILANTWMQNIADQQKIKAGTPAPATRKTAPKASVIAPFTCNINADYVLRAAQVKNADPDHEALYGVQIAPAQDTPGVYIIGCNGHQFIMMHDVTGTASRPGTIYPDKSFLAAMSKGDAPRLCVNSKAVGELTRPGMTVRQEQFTHDRYVYPDVMCFLARARDAKPVSGYALPARQLAAMTGKGKADTGSLMLYSTGTNTPVFVRDIENDDFLGIIMPIALKEREQDFTLPVPAWAESLAGCGAPEVAPAIEDVSALETAAAPETTPAPEAARAPMPVRLSDIAAALERGESIAQAQAAPVEAETTPAQEEYLETAQRIEAVEPILVEAALPEDVPTATVTPVVATPRRVRGRNSTLRKQAPAPVAAEAIPAPVSLPEILPAVDLPASAYSVNIVIAPAYLGRLVRAAGC